MFKILGFYERTQFLPTSDDIQVMPQGKGIRYFLVFATAIAATHYIKGL